MICIRSEHQCALVVLLSPTRLSQHPIAGAAARKGRGAERSSNPHTENKRNLRFLQWQFLLHLTNPHGKINSTFWVTWNNPSPQASSAPKSTCLNKARNHRRQSLEGTLGVHYPLLSLNAGSTVLTIADKPPSTLTTKKSHQQWVLHSLLLIQSHCFIHFSLPSLGKVSPDKKPNSLASSEAKLLLALSTTVMENGLLLSFFHTFESSYVFLSAVSPGLKNPVHRVHQPSEPVNPLILLDSGAKTWARCSPKPSQHSPSVKGLHHTADVMLCLHSRAQDSFAHNHHEPHRSLHITDPSGRCHVFQSPHKQTDQPRTNPRAPYTLRKLFTA